MSVRTTVEQVWEISFLTFEGIGLALAPTETVAGLVAESLTRQGAVVLTVERVA